MCAPLVVFEGAGEGSSCRASFGPACGVVGRGPRLVSRETCSVESAGLRGRACRSSGRRPGRRPRVVPVKSRAERRLLAGRRGGPSRPAGSPRASSRLAGSPPCALSSCGVAAAGLWSPLRAFGRRCECSVSRASGRVSSRCFRLRMDGAGVGSRGMWLPLAFRLTVRLLGLIRPLGFDEYSDAVRSERDVCGLPQRMDTSACPFRVREKAGVSVRLLRERRRREDVILVCALVRRDGFRFGDPCSEPGFGLSASVWVLVYNMLAIFSALRDRVGGSDRRRLRVVWRSPYALPGRGSRLTRRLGPAALRGALPDEASTRERPSVRGLLTRRRPHRRWPARGKGPHGRDPARMRICVSFDATSPGNEDLFDPAQG